MASISVYLGKAMLDWSLLGATPTRPANSYVGIALVAPTSTNGSEIATGSGMTRQTVAFSAAASPANTAGNSVAMTFGPISAIATVQGIQVWDTGVATAGNMLWYGNLTTSRTMNGGDSLVFAVGALEIGLA
jgi:hypothetical protein